MTSTCAEPYTWICVDAPYLRTQAERCTRLARDFSKMPTEKVAHELEAIGIELMRKASELDHLQGDLGTNQSTPK
jgi:hypothetical protein